MGLVPLKKFPRIVNHPRAAKEKRGPRPFFSIPYLRPLNHYWTGTLNRCTRQQLAQQSCA